MEQLLITEVILTEPEAKVLESMKREAADMLKNYKWMGPELARLTEVLADAGEGVVGSYGDPNSGIRAQFINSDKTGREVVRRSRLWTRHDQLALRCSRFESAMEKISDAQQQTMLDWLLEGMPVTNIARWMKISRRHAQDIKKHLVDNLAWAMFNLHVRINDNMENGVVA